MAKNGQGVEEALREAKDALNRPDLLDRRD
jgi:hypothetical protein